MTRVLKSKHQSNIHRMPQDGLSPLGTQRVCNYPKSSCLLCWCKREQHSILHKSVGLGYNIHIASIHKSCIRMVFLRKGKETISHQKVIFQRKLCPDVAVFTFLLKTKVMTEYLNPRGKKQNDFRRYLILKLVKKEQKKKL